MRRLLALLLLISGTVTGAPATAQASQCEIIEQVYGISRVGDLIVQPFCASADGFFLEPRVLASFGTNVPLLIYGGQLSDGTVVIYGVGADGALSWYQENPATGRLGAGVVVGSQFGDWRRYQHLQTLGNGELSGVDAQGRLWRWTHEGWQDGSDTWAGPAENLGDTCAGTRPVFAGHGATDLYIGVTASAFVYCGQTGQTHTVSVLPAGTEAVTMAVSPHVTYALQRERVTRLILHGTTWIAGAVARASLDRIFSGRSTTADGTPPVFKYEWQWTWYGEDL